MTRWLSLLVISAFVFSGIQGCVLVVADEDVAQEIREERNRSRLARDIQKEIDRDALLEYSDIDVSEDHGEVTLAGAVDGVAAMQRAVDIALSHADVADLRLRLHIELDD